MLIKILKKIIFIFSLFFSPDKYYSKAKSQNNNLETKYLEFLESDIKNKYFIEIGFHNMEFNCLAFGKKLLGIIRS